VTGEKVGGNPKALLPRGVLACLKDKGRFVIYVPSALYVRIAYTLLADTMILGRP